MTFAPTDRYNAVIAKIDAANDEDPRRVVVDGVEKAYETVYADRMMHVLDRMYPDAGELLRIASRAQHIRRWSIPRNKYPVGREGYDKWRRELRALHAEIVGGFMTAEGYSAEDCELVAQFLQKMQLKKHPDSQALENVVDVVFLEYYWDEFAAKYSDYDDDKMVDIVGKTLRKMSSHGHKAALALNMPESQQRIVMMAVEREKDRLAAMAAVEKF